MQEDISRDIFMPVFYLLVVVMFFVFPLVLFLLKKGNKTSFENVSFLTLLQSSLNYADVHFFSSSLLRSCELMMMKLG